MALSAASLIPAALRGRAKSNRFPRMLRLRLHRLDAKYLAGWGTANPRLSCAMAIGDAAIGRANPRLTGRTTICSIGTGKYLAYLRSVPIKLFVSGLANHTNMNDIFAINPPIAAPASTSLG
jgi:hypothetical protein